MTRRRPSQNKKTVPESDSLRRIPLFSRLNARELGALRRIARVRRVDPGRAIFSKSEAAGSLFVVLEGRVKIFTHGGGRKKKTFSNLEAGDFFGEMALLEGKNRSASAQAQTPCRLLIITKSGFKKLLLGDARLALYLLRTVCERLRRADEELENLLFRNLLGRTAKTLSVLARRAERRSGGRILEPLSRRELADIIGTSREPLVRALGRLRRAGVIRDVDGRIFIPRPERLDAFCPDI